MSILLPPADVRGSLIPDYENIVRLFCSLVGTCFALDTPESLDRKIRDIKDKYTQENVFACAEAATSGFSFPQEVFTRDASALSELGSLEKLVRARQRQRRDSRFNMARCQEVFGDDPEFSILFQIASEGVRIDCDPSFVCCPLPDRKRQIESRLPCTLATHAYDLWKSGAVLLLPRSLLEAFNPHYSNVHWVPKPGVPIGRFLGDCSNREDGNPLNSVGAKEQIKARFGALNHPSIGDIVQMILNFAMSAGGMHNVVLWKEDVAGAFGQYNHGPADAHLLCFPVEQDLAMVYTAGMFGWTGSPYAFGPFSRAFKRQCNKRISGCVEVYVDDFMGVSTRDRGFADQKIAQELIVEALGPSGINLSKSFPPSRVTDLIGWTIDIDAGTLRPNAKGIEKLTLAFAYIDLTAPQSLHTFQVLGSLACRYSQGLLGMRPFVQPLYAMTQGWRPSQHRKSIPSTAKLAIIMWRSVALLLLSDPKALAVPLTRFHIDERKGWDFYVISDAGPLALGVAIYDSEDVCQAHASYPLPFHAEESKYQNAREFQGLLLGELILCWLGINNSRIMWKGDNVSALSWARDNSCRSSTAQVSFIAHSWLSVLSGNELLAATHQAGSTMGDIDGLSRFRDTKFSSETDVSLLFVHIHDLFLLCDPTLDRPSLTNHYECLCTILDTLKHFLSLCRLR